MILPLQERSPWCPSGVLVVSRCAGVDLTSPTSLSLEGLSCRYSSTQTRKHLVRKCALRVQRRRSSCWNVCCVSCKKRCGSLVGENPLFRFFFALRGVGGCLAQTTENVCKGRWKTCAFVDGSNTLHRSNTCTPQHVDHEHRYVGQWDYHEVALTASGMLPQKVCKIG